MSSPPRPRGDGEAQALLVGVQYQLADCKRQLMLKDEEMQALQKEIQALRQSSSAPAPSGAHKSSTLSLFSKSNKKEVALKHELDALQQKEAQLEPLKRDIRRLQEENAQLQAKLACQKEWGSHDEYVDGLQQEIQSLKDALEQEQRKLKLKDEELTQLLEETMARSSKDMEEMNRLMEQVARLSRVKQTGDDALRELSEAQHQIRRLEEEITFLSASKAQPTSPDSSPAKAIPERAASATPSPVPEQQEAILAKWRTDLQRLETAVQEREATIVEQGAELAILREVKATHAARIEELEARQRAFRQEKQSFVKVIKDLQGSQAALMESSKSLEADLRVTRKSCAEQVVELERRLVEIRTLREAAAADGRRWVRETVVGEWLLQGLERKLLTAERAQLEAQVKKLEHALREKTDACEALEEKLDELQEEALQLVQQVRRSTPTGKTPRDPRDKHHLLEDAGKSIKTLGKNIQKLKIGNKGKENIEEMRKLVQETLQKNMDLEEQHKWLRDHARNKPS